MYLLVIRQLLIMLIIAASSFFVTKKFKFGKKEQQFVSKILLLYINPCLIISHFDVGFNLELLKGFAMAFGIAIVVHFAMFGVSIVLCRSKTEEDKALDCLDRLGSVLTNCGFVGIPLISGLGLENGVFYLLAFLATFNIFLWTFGYYLMAGKVNFKKIITNPNIICIILGLVIFCLPYDISKIDFSFMKDYDFLGFTGANLHKFPMIFQKPLHFIGSMNTPVAMILLGMLFANFQKNPEVSYTKRLVKVCIIRHLVMMVVVLAVVLPVYYLLPEFNQINVICMVTIIAALCPTGMSVSSFAVLFEKDESYAALICMTTSVICIGTLPASVALVELFVK